MKFYFRWGLKKLDIDITSREPVSNGEWHQVAIDTDQYNVRCMLDMNEKILDIPEDVPKVTLFSGIMYIGGIPERFVTVLFLFRETFYCFNKLFFNHKKSYL